jgi:dTDP-4-dehydrorhamnose reductase
MTNQKTILIFGVSSFLGSNLAEQLKDKYRVVGTYFDNETRIDGVLSLKCDVHQKDQVLKVSFLVKPDITIYAVGLSSIRDCHDYPKVADALNTAGVFNVSAAAERYNSKFIYFSTSYIFSGEDILFRENDTPMPSTMYGSTMASSEFYIQKSCLNYIIFRCSPLIGRSYQFHSSNWVETLDRLTYQNKKILCDTKIHTGYLDVLTLASIVDEAIDKNITNRLFQISSTDIMNKFDFSSIYLESIQGNQSLLSKSDWDFPKLDNQVTKQQTVEESYYRMDLENAMDTFATPLLSAKDSLKKVLNQYSGAIGSAKKKSSGVSFI